MTGPIPDLHASHGQGRHHLARGTSLAEAPLTLGVLGAGFFALWAWLTPTHHFTWPSFHGEFAMALAGLVFFALVIWRGCRTPVTVPPLATVTLLAALIPLIQAAGGLVVFRGDAGIASLYLFGFALAQIAGQRAAALWGIERLTTAFATVILLGAVASTWLALCQWLQLDYLGDAQSGLPPGYRPFANFNQPNQFATLVVLGLLCVAILFNDRRMGRGPAALVLAFLGLGLAVAQSRAGLLELVVVGLLLLLAGRRSEVRLQWQAVIGGLILVLAMTGVFMLVNSLLDQAAARDTSAMATAGTRTVHWTSMLDAVSRRPWTGYGWNQVVLAQYAVAPSHPPTGEMITYSHDLLLDLLVWNGIPLGLALAAALVTWFVQAWRHLQGPSSLLALACVTAVFTHAMVEYPLAYLYFLLPTGVLMGAIDRSATLGTGWRAPLPIVCAVLALSVTAVALVGRDFLEEEEDVNALRLEAARVGLESPRRVLSDPLLLTQLAAFVHFVRVRETENMSPTAIDSMADVVRRFPSATNLTKFAAALALNKRPQEASDVLRRVCLLAGAPSCELQQKLWLAAGVKKPLIAVVKWPP